MIKGRILYLGGFELPDKNAAAQRVMSNAQLLREMGYEVSFVGVVRDNKEQAFYHNGFCCKCLKYPAGIKEWLYHVLNFLPISDIEKYAPQYIILYNFPAIASLKILHYCRKHKIKVVHDLTEWEQTDGWSPRSFIKRLDTTLRMHYCMKKMDGVIAISRYLYNLYKNKVNTILVPPTVDTSNPKWNRNRKLTASNPITLVYAGSPGGGVKDRLDLIVEEVRKIKKIKLIVVGLDSDQFFDSFHRQRETYENVEFKGRLPHKEAVSAVCNSDFQMLIRDHNRKNDAGFPTKLAESMTCGTPVIATVFSNITDYVKDGFNGFLIKGNNSMGMVLNRISELSHEEIIAMKRNCLSMNVFNYKYYQTGFSKLFD